MERSNLLDKKFKVMVTKLLTELGKEWINIVSEKFQQTDGNYKNVPNRSHRTGDYNNETEKYTKRLQQPTR